MHDILAFMIGFLRGIVKSTNQNTLLIDVSGVGYRVLSPLSLAVTLSKNDPCELYIHTHVREDQITLYGFKEEADLFVFEKLISVSGIGPKSALAMLSVHSPSSLAQAIEEGNTDLLSHTPGVGKKTAEKIILELKGKLSMFITEEKGDETLEVRLALEALGYSPKEIMLSLKELTDKEGKSTSTLIKEALQQLQ